MENQNQMNQNNDYSNAEITIDKNFIIMFKFRQIIQYGVSIERIVFPKSYEYVNDFVKGLDKVEKVETGQDENVYVWMSVPSDSEYLDENRIPICGDYLAKKFKKDMEAMILLNVPEDLIDTVKDSDMMKVKTKYRIRNEKWTKEKGKAKVALYTNFQENYPFQDA